MLVNPPASCVVTEVAHGQLRRPAQVARRVSAETKRVALHQAGDTAAGSAVLAVAVCNAEASPTPAAVATAARVFVRATKNVPRLVGEHAVDVVGAPAVIVVVHHEPWSADARIGEPRKGILGEEAAVSPARPEAGTDVFDVRQHAVPVRAIPDRSHRRVAPEGLEVWCRGIGRNRQVHILDVVREGDAGKRIVRRVPAEAVLHLSHYFDHFLIGELQVRRGPLHDHDADRHRPFEVRTGRSGRTRTDRPHLDRRARRDRCAARHVPALAGTRPPVLGVPIAWGFA